MIMITGLDRAEIRGRSERDPSCSFFFLFPGIARRLLGQERRERAGHTGTAAMPSQMCLHEDRATRTSREKSRERKRRCGDDGQQNRDHGFCVCPAFGPSV
jgi:hypothetical protein